MLGHEVTLLSTKRVRPFVGVGGNKSDEHDARAIWTALERLPWMVIQTLREQWARVIRLDKEVGDIERWLKRWHRNNVVSRRIAEIPGVGILSATAAVAAMGDPDAFRSAREFAAWLGLVPRHRLPPSVAVRPIRN